MSIPSWAVRYCASLEGVVTVLSGMSDEAQLQDNVSYMADFKPLSDSEREVIGKAVEVLDSIPTIPCTGCKYCVDGCPRSIPIPEYFSLYNDDQQALRQGRGACRARYEELAEAGGRASACVACRQCEQQCPQHLPITQWLEKVKKTYEG